MPGLDLAAGVDPVRMDFETTDPTDDIRVTFSDGRRAFVSAKRKVSKGSPLKQTVAGWIAQAATLGDSDLLVIGGEEFIGPMRHLDRVLRRYRAGLPMETKEEQTAFDTVADLLPPDVCDLVLDRARVLQVDGTTSAGTARALQEALMDLAVVDAQGQQAVAVLADLFHRQAGQALGSGIDEWVGALNNAGVPVIEDRAGPAGMRTAARLAAVGLYRDRMSKDAGRIDLSLLAEDLEPITVDRLVDGIEIRVEGATNGTELLRYVRGWRRMLIIGQPGAGKSVALREIAAHCATHPFAPMPIRVSLPRMLQQQTERFTLRDLIEASVEGMFSPDQRISLVEYLAEAAGCGRAIFLCDGLDECGVRAAWVAQQLVDIVDSLPPTTGVIVATRANSESASARLNLPRVELAPPQDLGATVNAILDACAESRVSAPERPTWLTTRRAWIEEAKEQHEDLLSVPLLAVLVALICADTADAELPKGRAALLHRAIEQSVLRWERTRMSVGQTGLWSPTLTTAMLLDGFIVLGRLLDGGGTASRTQALGSLTRLLGDPEQWAMAPAQAGEVSKEVLRFWDERVAVFVVDDADEVTTRSKVFTEIATAMWASNCGEDEVMGWLAEALEYTDSDGAIGLAAGLDPRIVKALLDLGDRGKPNIGLLVAELADRGIVTLGPAELNRTLAQLTAGVLAIARGEEVAARWPKEPPKFGKPRLPEDLTWRFVESACLLALPAGARSMRSELIARAVLDGRAATIAVALCALTDVDTDNCQLDHHGVMAVDNALAIPLPQTPEVVEESRRRFAMLTGEDLAPGLDRVALGASYRLDELGNDAGPQLARIAKKAGQDIATRISTMLERSGISTDQEWTEFKASMKPHLAMWQKRRAALISDLAALASPSVLFSPNDALWSLSDLGSILAATSYGRFDAAEIDRATTYDSAEFRRSWLAAISDAYGLDKAAIANQARYIHSRGVSDGSDELHEWLVASVGPYLKPRMVEDLGSVLANDQLLFLLSCLEAESDWIAWSAANVLINVSEPPWNCRDLFDKDMSSWPRARASLTYTVAILTAGGDRENLVAEAVASGVADYRYAARMAISVSDLDPDGAYMKELSRDADLSVRPATCRASEPTPTLWSCNLCRSVNPIDVEDCHGCTDGVRPA
ncbi:NACHT domain-containing protein [Nocardia salmonicida]|uniref:NACHT domain-containing protein n=1 Tax=Nocardia salmonicida TaxID=53431 RepID=UPI001BDE426B|nr:hypothetical protein [Nocardia salmonicida]